jgi:hypothetical protein
MMGGEEAAMTPVDGSHPTARRELLVWENEELKASLFRGLADAAEGRTERLDWLTDDQGEERPPHP